MKHTPVRPRSIAYLSLLSVGLLFFLILSLLTERETVQPKNPAASLRINEVCIANPGTPLGDSVTYEDYIELYNPTDETISLDSLSLSDNAKRLDLGPLPADTLEPGGYYVIYATGAEGKAPEGAPSLPFRLSEEESVSLNYRTEYTDGSFRFTPIDSVTIPTLFSNAVYGRVWDGDGAYAQLRPSPGLSNNAVPEVLTPPLFSKESGFYRDGLSLALISPSGLPVHYTLDGTEPTSDSPLYTEPLTLFDPSLHSNIHSSQEDIVAAATAYTVPDEPVDKAVIVRATVFDSRGNYSNPATATYFLDFQEKTGYENAAVLSLVTDPDHLFGRENGIYVRGDLYENALAEGVISEEFSWNKLINYTNYYMEGIASERTAHLDFFDGNRSLAQTQNCGIRIRGNESRSFPQKSFTLFSRKRYGTSTFSPVFFDSGISYPDLILNNGKNLKKVFFFPLVADRSAAVQKFQPCQVFLNGEYWGMYYLMEKYSAEYLEGRYGTPAEDALLIKATYEVQDGDPQDISRFKALREYLKQDMSDPKLYQGLLEQMDMQSFIDWMCTNIYIANTDTKPLGGNVFTWQTLVPDELEYQDGKWRWMLYDLDDSLAVGMDTSLTPAWAVDSFVEHAGYAPCGFLDDEPMTALMKNEDFRRQFVLTFLDMANENFSPSRVNTLLNQMEAQYTPWADKSYERWNTNPTDPPFSQQVGELRDFFEYRFDAIVPRLADHFELTGELVPLTLSADTPEGGTVQLNTLHPDLSGEWTGSYYTDYPLTLTALPAEGFRFAGWQLENGALTEGTSQSMTIQIQLEDKPVSVQAVFEKIK